MKLGVCSAPEMTVTGIQGCRSALDSSRLYEIPDFRRKEVRDRYRLGKIEPSAAAFSAFRRHRAEFEQKLRDQH